MQKAFYKFEDRLFYKSALMPHSKRQRLYLLASRTFGRIGDFLDLLHLKGRSRLAP